MLNSFHWISSSVADWQDSYSRILFILSKLIYNAFCFVCLLNINAREIYKYQTNMQYQIRTLHSHRVVMSKGRWYTGMDLARLFISLPIIL